MCFLFQKKFSWEDRNNRDKIEEVIRKFNYHTENDKLCNSTVLTLTHPLHKFAHYIDLKSAFDNNSRI